MVIEKDGLRSQFKRQLNALPGPERQRQSDRLVQKLSKFLSSYQGCWTIFSPLNDEPNLLPLLKISEKITWVFPKIESKEVIQFYKVTSPERMMTNSFLQIGEPEGNQEDRVEPQEITGVLVPGLAFDSHGTRLGRGGGYYDRYLEKYKGLKLGVTFNEGLTNEALPREPHDQKMNIVISPDLWIEVDTSEVSNGI